MSPQTWTDGVHRAATSCDSLRGDELALGNIPQLSSVMDQHKVPRFSYMEAIGWNLSHWLASVGEAGFDVGRVRVGTLRISAVTRLGHTEWLPLSAGKKTHILITTGSLVMALFECIPTCEWGSETGRREVRNISLRVLLAGRQSEWASCRSTITNRPAAWEGLPNIIHMCHILSEPPPGLAVHSRREGGVPVRAYFTQARGQLGSALAVKWPLRRGRLQCWLEIHVVSFPSLMGGSLNFLQPVIWGCSQRKSKRDNSWLYVNHLYWFAHTNEEFDSLHHSWLNTKWK